MISTKQEPIPRCATAIGDSAVDLAKYAKAGKLQSIESEQKLSLSEIFSEVNTNEGTSRGCCKYESIMLTFPVFAQYIRGTAVAHSAGGEGTHPI